MKFKRFFKKVNKNLILEIRDIKGNEIQIIS
jgi:hypothetical protein